MIKIAKVERKSIAHELGIKRGDFLVSINKKEPEDRLEMMYFDSLKKIVIVIKNAFDGSETVYKIKKEHHEKLGIELEGFEEINAKWCRNKSIFCFVDQLPNQLSKTLYVKDDDWRISFLTGKYVSMTNITPPQIKRIITQSMSPLYVSVHATNEKVRRKIFGITSSMPILKLIKKLTRNKIEVYCQIVLCPGINDGAILHRTIKDLLKCGKYMKSVAIVPVQLTKYRAGLPQIKPVSKEDAKKALQIIHRLSDKFFSRRGEHSAFASDELYLKAGEEFPSYSYYGEFKQLENGVGALVKFEHEFLKAMKELKFEPKNASYTLVSGVSSHAFMNQLVQKFNKEHPNVDVNVAKIINNYLGESISETSLLTGEDILGQISSLICNKNIILPRSLFRFSSSTFLDNMTLDELKSALNKKVYIAGETGDSLVQILAGKGGEIA